MQCEIKRSSAHAEVVRHVSHWTHAAELDTAWYNLDLGWLWHALYDHCPPTLQREGQTDR